MLPASLSPHQFNTFRAIRDQFAGTSVPGIDKWRAMSDDDIWLRVVSQVVVVGKEAPAHHLSEPSVRTRLSYLTLAAMAPGDAAKAIGSVLASIGTRYVSVTQPEASPKVNALMKNLRAFKNYPQGPRALVERLAVMGSSRERIAYLGKHFAYLKAKGARDFLTTGLGMATDVIALDSRVMGIASHIVPELPTKVSDKNYDAIEAFLIQHVCTPLGLSAVQFDQILFRNQPAIEAFLRTGSFPDGSSSLNELSASELQALQAKIAEEILRRQAVSS